MVKLSIISTIRLCRITQNFNKRGLFVKAYKGISLSIAKGAKIILKKGKLSINKGWVRKDPFPFLLVLGKNASIEVDRSFDIYSGGKIYVNDNAHLSLGGGYINHNINISVFKKVTIGNECAIGENVVIRDSDNHIINGNEDISKPIVIGDHVWIGSNVTILKGVSIGDGSVVAAGSIVINDVPAGSLVGGVPARILKEEISWK